MKKNIIYFMQSKGLFSIWLLIMFIIGDVSDKLEHHKSWDIDDACVFLLWFYGFFTLWLIKDLIWSAVTKKPLQD